MSRSLLTLLAVLILPACGGSSYMVQGRAPFIGADVHVEVNEEGGTRLVEIELTNLVPPNRVSESTAQYVLWIAPIGGAPVRAANIVYDAGNRSGSATATFPDPQFNVIVTAEAEGTPSTPSTNVVVEQRVDDR
jgi:hypothetical protein